MSVTEMPKTNVANPATSELIKSIILWVLKIIVAVGLHIQFNVGIANPGSLYH
jgi:hypothetical protein